MDEITINTLKKKLETKIDKGSEFLKPQWRTYLAFSYLPPNPKFREKEIEDIALKIIDNVRYRSTRNILIFGPSGSGKTMSFRVASYLADDILKDRNVGDYRIIYVRTGRPISTAAEICEKIGEDVPKTGFSLEDYLKKIEKSSENIYIHVCLDEFDNLLTNRKYFEKFLYFFTRTENLSATFITNRLNIVKEIGDPRIISSFDQFNSIQFLQYNEEQVRDILQDRIELAFVEGAILQEALALLSKTIANGGGDIRKGLSILQLCGDYILSTGERITEEIMAKLIQEHEILADVRRLISLPLSDKIILAAIYSIYIAEHNENIRTDYVFAEQDYFRKVLELESISQESFSVYLTRLVSYGIISIKKQGLGKGKGGASYIRLRYSDSVLRRMLETDSSLKKILEIIKERLHEKRHDATKLFFT